MAEPKSPPSLSPCLESVQRQLADKPVSAVELVRSICRAIDPEGKQAVYSEILEKTTSLQLPASRTFEQWRTLLCEACAPQASILHTSLALLLTARLVPEIASCFAGNIDQALRNQLYEFIADMHSEHEIVSKQELQELIFNARKLDSRPERQGRTHAAIIYAADQDLSLVETWCKEIKERYCVVVRLALPITQIDTLLPQALPGALDKAGSEHTRAMELAQHISSAIRSSPGPLNGNRLLDVAEPILAAPGFNATRLILLLEVEGLNHDNLSVLNQWLQQTIAHRHDRLIVVAGGVPEEATFKHTAETWAYRLKAGTATEGIGQTICNDTTGQQQDLLNLSQETDALTDIIASNALTPPLVVGICGGWGAGKSFILDLIERRLREIRRQPLPQTDALHVGHIYWIEFDAWTYSKQNLWASLMDQICSQFEDQLNVEYIQFKDRNKEPPRIPPDLPPWVVAKELAGEYRQNLSDLLLNIKQPDFSAQKEKLNKTLEQAEQQEQALRRKRDEAIENQTSKRLVMDFAASIPARLLDTLGVDTKQLNSLKELSSMLEKDKKLLARLQQALCSPAVYLLLLMGGAALLVYVIEGNDWSLPGSLTMLLSSAGVAVERLIDTRNRVRKRIDKALGELEQKQAEAFRQSSKQYDLENDFAEQLNKIRESKQQAAQQLQDLQQQSGTSSADLLSLQDFLTQVRGQAIYSSQLGLLNQVQTHLKKLSALICQGCKHLETGKPLSGDHFPFPRGTPRIILKIDDLDRCPPEQVVEVLEAAQLLVKTDLFVVLIALDLRYVTRAIEKRYAGILSHDLHPTGLDYIEKIIQLPYQVRPIAADHLHTFFSGQLEYVADQTLEPPQTLSEIAPAEITDETQSRDIRIPKKLLQKQVLQLTEPEFKMLVEICKPLGLSPRSGKRIGNVYKIWKLLWHQRGAEPSEENGHKQALLTLLALSTVRPRLTRHGLQILTHAGRQDPSGGETLNKIFSKLAQQLNEPAHIQALFNKEQLFDKRILIGSLAAQDLALLVSFSFVGDDGHQQSSYRKKSLSTSQYLAKKYRSTNESKPD